MIKVTTFTEQLNQNLIYSLWGSLMFLSILLVTYFVAEPVVGHGQAADTSTFTIRQTITDETSFLVNPSNVTMAGSINGVTGGNATGTTSFVVQSNNSAGYYVEVAFFDNGTPEAMIGDVSGSESIRDYDGDVGGQPSRFFTASTASQFAYNVTSSTTADTDLSFMTDNVTCNAGSFTGAQICWKAPAVAGFRIIDRSTAAVSGATSTIQFKVHVPSGAVPVPQAETYTATATLSLFIK